MILPQRSAKWCPAKIRASRRHCPRPPECRRCTIRTPIHPYSDPVVFRSASPRNLDQQRQSWLLMAKSTKRNLICRQLVSVYVICWWREDTWQDSLKNFQVFDLGPASSAKRVTNPHSFNTHASRSHHRHRNRNYKENQLLVCFCVDDSCLSC